MLGTTASWADTVKVTGAPSACEATTVMVPGTVITGPVVSTTCTGKDSVRPFDRLSAALHITMVVPRRKVLPDMGVQMTATLPSTRSVAELGKKTCAPSGEVASVGGGGVTLMIGGVVSTTVTGNGTLLSWPVASELVQVTVVVASGKVAPDGGVQPT